MVRVDCDAMHIETPDMTMKLLFKKKIYGNSDFFSRHLHRKLQFYQTECDWNIEHKQRTGMFTLYA